MEKIFVNELKNHIDEEITFGGFVDAIRDKKWVMFVILKDHTGRVQMTIEKSEEQNQKLLDIMSNVTKDSTIKIKAKVVSNDAVKLGGIELIPEYIEVTSKAEELPFDYNNLEGVNLDTRLDYRWLDIRNDKNMMIHLVSSEMVRYMREYLYNNGFTEIHTPKIIGAASESGSEVFEVKYFDRSAYLAQSPQFYKQMALAAGLDKVFEVAPCFRAENSNTSRHATEFTSFDLEFAYIKDYHDVMNLEAEMITYALTKLNESMGERIKEVLDIDIVVPKLPFPEMKLKDIYKELEERYDYKIDDSLKNDLTTEAERLVYKLAKDKFDSEFMFVVDFPAEKRAFYHMRDEEGRLQGFDLIWRGTEITTGAQREHRYEEIVKNAKEKGLGDDVKFYLDFFKYGCPPHGGFAIGVDRLTMLLLDVPSVKETQFIFRGPTRLNP
ncbi:MAG: aspartate--tRNA(Asn) ligase [Bacilli bacterium]|nr:aspartate--tRNA(Asn) ligase [Bacilli bacterium]